MKMTDIVDVFDSFCDADDYHRDLVCGKWDPALFSLLNFVGQ